MSAPEPSGTTSAVIAVTGAPPPSPAPTSNTSNPSPDSSGSANASSIGQQASDGASAAGTSPPDSSTDAPAVEGSQTASPPIAQSSVFVLSYNASASLSGSPSNPSAPGWPFNATVAFTLNSTSPMIGGMDGARYLKYEQGTGYRITDTSNRLPGGLWSSFVGTGFGINGTTTPSPPPENNTLYQTWNDTVAWNIRGRMWMGPRLALEASPLYRFNPIRIDEKLGEMVELDLRSYEMSINWPRFRGLSFHNATVHVPYKSQA